MGTIASKRVSCILLLLLMLTASVGIARAADLDAAKVLQTTGVRGGLVVHLGCGDGKLTAGLRANDSALVHGLDIDAKKISAARERISNTRLAGKVTFDVLRSNSLPYTDNLVNLIVSDDLGEIPVAEAMRVL
ncbi:MAG: class I SAM-dependent methyltransferase, partial [Phycisphaerae bacterium]|nr:class I SAM-dependent methyltransferase [Phycisphaerae bacterium]